MEFNIKNVSKTVIAIVLFLAVFFWWRSAEAGELELGATGIGSDFSEGAMLYYGERFAEKWDVGIGVTSEQRYKGVDVGINAFVTVQRIVKDPWWGKIELGVGIAGFQNTNRALGCIFTFHPSLFYSGDRFGIGYRHFSNSGSCEPNAGQNGLMFRWSF